MDATNNDRLGRFVNDSPEANSKMKVIQVKHKPRLCLFADEFIKKGQEIRYDYDAPDLWWRITNVSSLFLK